MNRTKGLNKTRDAIKSKKIEESLPEPIPEEEVPENFYLSPEGKVNPDIVENIDVHSAKYNEVQNKKLKFTPKKEVKNIKKNYIDNKPIVSKQKHTPTNKKCKVKLNINNIM